MIFGQLRTTLSPESLLNNKSSILGTSVKKAKILSDVIDRNLKIPKEQHFSASYFKYENDFILDSKWPPRPDMEKDVVGSPKPLAPELITFSTLNPYSLCNFSSFMKTHTHQEAMDSVEFPRLQSRSSINKPSFNNSTTYLENLELYNKNIVKPKSFFEATKKITSMPQKGYLRGDGKIYLKEKHVPSIRRWNKTSLLKKMKTKLFISILDGGMITGDFTTLSKIMNHLVPSLNDFEKNFSEFLSEIFIIHKSECTGQFMCFLENQLSSNRNFEYLNAVLSKLIEHFSDFVISQPVFKMILGRLEKLNRNAWTRLVKLIQGAMVRG
jgi:hypothetical protein